MLRLHAKLLLALICFLIPSIHFAQAPDLGVASSFALFSAAGAFEVTGAATVVTGDVGTNVGAFNAFPPGTLIGSTHVADAISAQAAADVATAYMFLDNITCDLVLGTPFGNGQILTPGVYCIGSAAALDGDLVLDGECNPDVFFLIQIDGALSTNANSNIILKNGASLCNVFWQINGAVNLGPGSTFRGTFLCNGAINLAFGATLFGRGLSAAGAISLTTNTVDIGSQSVAFEIKCPSDTVVDCSSGTDPSITGMATSTDTMGSCGISSIRFEDSVVAGECPNEVTIFRLWIALDNCGNADSCTQIISKVDTTKPVFVEVLPQDMTVNCDAVPEAVILTATDNCSFNDGEIEGLTVDYSEEYTEGNCAYNYTLTRTWVATDECDNSTTHTQIVTVQDTTKPVFNEELPQDTRVNCDAVPEADILTATDNCSVSEGEGQGIIVYFSEDYTEGDCSNNYILTRTWVATDDCENSITHIQIVTVQDTTKPVFVEILPQDTTVNCDAVLEAVVLTATDNCRYGEGEYVTIDYNEVRTNGNCPYNYILTRTWVATDECNNSTTHIQIITVQDTTKPVFVESLPQDSTFTCNYVPQPVAYVLTATDNCSSSEEIIVNYSEIRTNGNCLYNYALTRTWVATDQCGNSTSHVQIITVQDTTKPVFVETLPQNMTVNCDAVPTALILTATDNCSTINVLYNQVRADGNCPYNYTLTRTWNATDDCGNSTILVQIVTVQDTAKPVFVETLPPNVTVNCNAVPAAVILTATDNCSTIIVLYNQVRADGDCPYNYTLTRTWNATDDCGNSSIHVQIVTVQDTTKPVFVGVLPPSVTVNCDAVPIAEILTATDNCSLVNVVYTEVRTNGDCPYNYTLTRTWIATDECGNSITYVQIVTVQDVVKPTLIINNPVFANAVNGSIIRLQCRSNEEDWELPTLLDSEISVSDNCGTPTFTMTQTVTDGDCMNNGYFKRIAVKIVVTDQCDNVTNLNFTIEVVDTIPPVFNKLPQDVTVSCEAQSWTFEITASDECECTTISYADTKIKVNCSGDFTLNRLYTATDVCGNKSYYTQIITVIDTTGPEMIPVNINFSGISDGDTLTTYCDSKEIPDWLKEAPASLMKANDLCNGPLKVKKEIRVTHADACWLYGYTKLYEVIFSAQDECNNRSEYKLYIRVLDTIAPVVQYLEEVICQIGRAHV